MRDAVFVDETDGNDVVALAEQSLGNLIAARRILIVGAPHLLTVDVGIVLVEERAEQETGRATCVLLVDMDVLAQPYGAEVVAMRGKGLQMGGKVVLVDGGPSGIVGREGVALVQQLEPSVGSPLVGLLLGSHVVVVLIQAGAFDHQGIVAAQRVGRYPGLDRRAAPAVDDDALRHTRLAEHAQP